MEKITRRRTGELVRKAFEILLAHPGGLPADAVLLEIEQTVPLTESERSTNLSLLARPFEQMAHFGTIGPIKAGWLVSEDGRWSVTDEGRRAFDQFEDPESFIRESARLSVKGWLAVYAPGFYSLVCKIKDQLATELKLARRLGPRHLLRQALRLETRWQKLLPVQPPRRLVVRGLDLATASELVAYLDSAGCAYRQGGHSAYIPPDSIRLSAFREVMRDYPPTAGLKISKNPGPVDESAYVFGETKNRGISMLYRRLTYGHRHLALVANMLFVKGLGPRLYDLVELQCGSQVWTAYVMDDVRGRVPTGPECEAALDRFRELEDRGLIKVTLAKGFEDEDFRPPDCNHNAFVDAAGKFHYIDFQSFHLTGYEAYLNGVIREARERVGARDRAALPRRAFETAAPVLELMAGAGVDVRERLVIEIGCGIGTRMAEFLKAGAKWCHGFEAPEITRHAEAFLLAMGCTRFSASGLGAGENIEDRLPAFLKDSLAGCIIYCSAGSDAEHLNAIARTPCRVVVYEGREEGFENGVRQVLSFVSGNLLKAVSYTDEDGDRRAIAVLSKGDRQAHPANYALPGVRPAEPLEALL